MFFRLSTYHFVKGDINDENLLEDLIKKIDYVVHLAAIVGEGACKNEPDLTQKQQILKVQKIKQFMFKT